MYKPVLKKNVKTKLRRSNSLPNIKVLFPSPEIGSKLGNTRKPNRAFGESYTQQNRCLQNICQENKASTDEIGCYFYEVMEKRLDELECKMLKVEADIRAKTFTITLTKPMKDLLNTRQNLEHFRKHQCAEFKVLCQKYLNPEKSVMCISHQDLEGFYDILLFHFNKLQQQLDSLKSKS